jgi:hypothetical protein
MNAPFVGRCLMTLKLVGDYLTKYDSIGDGVKGAPKKAKSDIHQLPSESNDFNWRIRCYASNGENIPMGDQINQSLPSTYLQFGWNLSDIK